ncbi:MAG TPA: hypothetical protein DF383_01455 [Deltaproteobacteria bacterium]|nr:hypothetical protein [Deltaproteobacteria bacterium]
MPKNANKPKPPIHQAIAEEEEAAKLKEHFDPLPSRLGSRVKVGVGLGLIVGFPVGSPVGEGAVHSIGI